MAAMESPEEVLIRKDLVAKCMSHVSERHRSILIARFGLNGDAGATFVELAKEYGLTKERIRQIELCALRKAQRFFASDPHMTGY